MTYEQARALQQAIWECFTNNRFKPQPHQAKLGSMYTKITNLNFRRIGGFTTEEVERLQEIEQEFKQIQMELLLQGETHDPD